MVTAMGVSMGLTSAAIMSKGTIAQKERWALDLLTLDKVGAWAITEPGSGSDAATFTSNSRALTMMKHTFSGEMKSTGRSSTGLSTCVGACRVAIVPPFQRCHAFLDAGRKLRFDLRQCDQRAARRVVRVFTSTCRSLAMISSGGHTSSRETSA